MVSLLYDQRHVYRIRVCLGQYWTVHARFRQPYHPRDPRIAWAAQVALRDCNRGPAQHPGRPTWVLVVTLLSLSRGSAFSWARPRTSGRRAVLVQKCADGRSRADGCPQRGCPVGGDPALACYRS